MPRSSKLSIPAALAVVLATSGFAVPSALAGHKFGSALTGDSAKIVLSQGCQVTKNPDHSIAVVCNQGKWALLRWSVSTNGSVSATVHAAHRLRYDPAVKQATIAGQPGYTVSQRVHSNTISFVETHFGP